MIHGHELFSCVQGSKAVYDVYFCVAAVDVCNAHRAISAHCQVHQVYIWCCIKMISLSTLKVKGIDCERFLRISVVDVSLLFMCPEW